MKRRPRYRGLVYACGMTLAGVPIASLGCAETGLAPPAGPPAAVVRAAGPAVLPAETEPAATRPLPISLDTVLRLAEEQNGL
ncbi:MAG TPA: hypothetical protein VKI65_20330, partial [Gemmataceae bacterium]|nr:hypothetical protein [Gemmataceae bacterium]